ncbi:MAG: DNA-deoxyinosine glycosylase [Brevundimonas sp.]|uniref:DNA-deoxyinosine glycosylase n=1 Tax=Brevundimonas sp. TaxID=1871086 RepID=UPI00271E8D78|nr:DNA-deoxyinosine glycosylase [Brevundimonas sp.]MDO9586510.1 DNA-deoxyinosine glycosylase [Brevundimonas sp.]MDP2765679.1 DNA-deoxyinosine glycosylase [Brevundimonas sp.]MDP3369794.1 DNA-deoxyinosine glycosylase [Brevundimonas sp.]MDP3656025.1 DNA-deoxyinosine glycosylase [Brevundimonas sp.]MDZ4109520.1 DNA-deoxyinosine glycosylase [Brevundimonas sp.]
MSFKRAFDPVVDASTRLLILGSLPGDASLKAGQYYGHPQNGFWPLVGGVIGVDLAALPYPERLETLKSAGVGLWDVIASARRPGSLDGAIRDAEAADLNRLIDSLPALKAVAFNGGTAARLGRRNLRPRPHIDLISLPSSSPAYTRPLAEKAAAWAMLASFVRNR